MLDARVKLEIKSIIRWKKKTTLEVNNDSKDILQLALVLLQSHEALDLVSNVIGHESNLLTSCTQLAMRVPS